MGHLVLLYEGLGRRPHIATSCPGVVLHIVSRTARSRPPARPSQVSDFGISRLSQDAGFTTAAGTPGLEHAGAISAPSPPRYPSTFPPPSLRGSGGLWPPAATQRCGCGVLLLVSTRGAARMCRVVEPRSAAR